MIQTHNLNLYRGDDRDITLSVSDSKGAIDLSSYQARCQVRDSTRNNGKVLLTLSSDDGSITVADNQLVLHVTHVDTATATWRQATYDVQLTDPQGKVKTIVRGQITLEHDVTYD